MNEDLVLAEIRRLTFSDDLPIDKLLKKIMCIASDFLSKNDERASHHNDVIMGNVLSFLRSKGVTHAHSKSSKHELFDTRAGIYPHDTFVFYALFSKVQGWGCFLGSSSCTLQVEDPGMESMIRGMNGFDIKHGMLFLVQDEVTNTYSKTVIIVPNRNLIQYQLDKLYVSIGTTVEIPLLKGSMTILPPHVVNWIYPPIRKESSL